MSDNSWLSPAMLPLSLQSFLPQSFLPQSFLGIADLKYECCVSSSAARGSNPKIYTCIQQRPGFLRSLPLWSFSLVVLTTGSILSLNGAAAANPSGGLIPASVPIAQAQAAPMRFIRSSSYQGAPSRGRARGGAARGNCPAPDLPLMAIVPITSADQPVPSELTVSAYPTFWFYVPYPLSPTRTVEFALLDEVGESVYETELTPSTASDGIVQVAMPSTAPPLESGKTYTWTFRVNCQPGSFVDIWGRVTRVTPDPALTRQLEQAREPIAQAALYANQGIWFDALTTLATPYHRQAGSGAIAQNWTSLLQSAGLTELANKPLLPCCSP